MNTKIVVYLICLFSVSNWTFSLCGQDLLKGGIPNIQNFEYSDLGLLPDSWCVAQGPKQHIYAGMSDGLLQYDGSKWRHINNDIPFYSLAIDSTGAIYYLSSYSFGQVLPQANGGYSVRDYSTSLGSYKYQIEKGLSNCLYFKGAIYFSCGTSIVRTVGSKSKLVTQGDNVFGKLFIANDRLYVQEKSKGLMEYVNGELKQLIPEASNANWGVIKSLIPTRNSNNSLIVIADSSYLFDISKHEHSLWGNSSKNANNISAAVRMPEGNIIATLKGKGIAVLNEKGETKAVLEEPIASRHSYIRDIFCDQNSFIWLASENALSICDLDSKITKWDGSTGLNDPVNKMLYNNSSGEVLIGTKNKIYSKETRTVKPLQGANSGSLDFCQISLSDGEEAVFYSVGNNALSEIVNGEISSLLTIKGAETVAHCSRYPDLLLVGTPDEVILLQNKKKRWKINQRKKISRRNQIREIEVDSRGRVWVIFSGEEFATMLVNKDQEEYELQNIQFGRTDPIFGKINQIFEWRGRTLFALKKGFFEYLPRTQEWLKDPLFGEFDDNANLVHASDRDQLWALVNYAGIRKLVKFSINDTKKIVWEEQTHTIPSDLNYTSILSCSNDRVLLAHLDGILEIDCSENVSNDFDLKTIINEVNDFNDAPLYASPFFFEDHENGSNHRINQRTSKLPIISHKSNGITFQFSSNKYLGQENIEYSYLLEGFDKNWSNWQKDTEKHYTNLPGGKYTFQIKSQDEFGNMGIADSFTFDVSSPWHEKSGIYLVYLLAGVLLGVAFLFFWDRESRKNYQRLEKEKEVEQEFAEKLIQAQEKEMQRIASDLHDEVGQRLTILKNMFTMMPIIITEKKKTELFEKSRSMLDLSIDTVRKVSRGLRPFQINVIGLSGAIEELGKSIEDNSDIKMKMNIDPIDHCFEKEQAFNIYRIIQEGINNAIKHGACTQIHIKIQEKDSGTPEVQMEIRDNGKGFDNSSSPTKTKLHFGLHSITSRTKALGGNFKIDSSIGSGTSLKFWFPILKSRNTGDL